MSKRAGKFYLVLINHSKMTPTSFHNHHLRELAQQVESELALKADTSALAALSSSNSVSFTNVLNNGVSTTVDTTRFDLSTNTKQHIYVHVTGSIIHSGIILPPATANRTVAFVNSSSNASLAYANNGDWIHLNGTSSFAKGTSINLTSLTTTYFLSVPSAGTNPAYVWMPFFLSHGFVQTPQSTTYIN
jgi:hypothetical protein